MITLILAMPIAAVVSRLLLAGPARRQTATRAAQAAQDEAAAVSGQ